ncbi:MAG TPA: L17 family ribosomal protein [Mycoplasmatales bacterium]|jgi:large subunit ribosomal protein L17|nr:L17 family ribosomal protein [Mycoplasmatales bacterium]
MSYIIRPGKRKKSINNNLSADIIIHGRIFTNYSNVKFLIKTVSKLIGFAKEGTLSSRRLALRNLNSRHEALNKLFDELGEKYKDKKGGYLRSICFGRRRGDGSKIFLVSLT